MATYLDRLTEAMAEIAESDPSLLIIGQSVRYPGTGMFATFAGVPGEQKIELPVFESSQLGISIGLSLAGHTVLSVFPRINFLLCAMDQLILHLDAIPRYSGFRPRVLIRTAVAHDSPLDPGVQHLGDYSWPIAGLLETVKVWPIHSAAQVLPTYRAALARDGSSILVEYHRLYGVEE